MPYAYILQLTSPILISLFLQSPMGGHPDLPLSSSSSLSKGWRQLYKNWSSRKINSRRLFSREYDFPKTFSLTENQFSRKTYFYTIRPWWVNLSGAPWCVRIVPGALIVGDIIELEGKYAFFSRLCQTLVFFRNGAARSTIAPHYSLTFVVI